MDAASAVVTVPATASATTTLSNTVNINHSNNILNTTTSSSNSINSIGVSCNSSNSNSSCSSSSTSSNSSGYGSTTTTPTNNYDIQQTTPTTTPVSTTPIAIAEPIIPVATIAAVTPFYNEAITTHNLEAYHHLHNTHTQQQQQHHLLPTNHHQLPQNHLQTNLQQQQQHHQYLSRQQYYSSYDYQQPAPTHNVTPAVAAGSYNMGITAPYELSPSTNSYGSGQYKSANLSAAINYERSTGVVRTNTGATNFNQQQHQQPQTEQTPSKSINQQSPQFAGMLATSKQRSSSLIGNSSSTSTTKPQAAATPFYAQPLTQTHSNPTPFYDNLKHKMPLEYGHDSYANPSAATAASYHQQQKYYAAAKSQLKESSYGSPTGLNNKSLYPNSSNFFPGPGSYDKYGAMYAHASATGYTSAGHMGNETPPDVGNYRKPVMVNSMNSPSWPWGIDYASGNSRTIPPPASHLPTATVAPTHATYLPPSPTTLTRDPYYMGPDKYAGMKYDKYTGVSFQQSYVSPPASRHHMWPNTPHASNLTQLNERHLLASGPPVPPTHGLHTTPYFPGNTSSGLNSRQSCCSQPYQPQSCYYPPSHAVAPRLPHNQSPTAPSAAGGGYLSAQPSIGQSPHLNALTASCKYGGILPDYGNGSKMKTSNDLYLNTHHYDSNSSPHNYGYGSAHSSSSQQLYASNAHTQPMAHGLTPSSLLTHDPLNTNTASYTNDLSLTTSNFDNYHTHLEPHLSPQTLAGIHGQQPPPPTYGPTVAKRALLDYRKPIQPQPPPTITEECYTTLASRNQYNQQELLNTPDTTTTFGEYEPTQQDNNTYTHSSENLGDSDKTNDEGNKNLSLRDFIANWNDDEDEYQNNEELNFDQNTVIEEVLQTAPVEQQAKVIIEETVIIKEVNSEDSKIEEEVKKQEENLSTTSLNIADVNQYVNLPDIVIDIEKSNNVNNNSITTPATSPTLTATLPQANGATALNLNNFDVEKELDELKLKKPAQQELTKDLNNIKEIKSVSTPQLSPCKNLTTQLSFEDLNLEPTNKTVLNSITTRFTQPQSSELNEQYFKDIEGYESGSSRHSNESAFEKEYETFINKITSETSADKCSEEQNETEVDKDLDFEQNVQDFSKFYKRKRKLKEDELKTNEPEIQTQKKPKTNEETKVNNSNFPQVYTKKSRNRFHQHKQQCPRKRKPLSAYYKIIHSIRRLGWYRLKRVREYMTELKEKHLPLIKRQSIKNYTHDIIPNLFNVKSLKALCIMAINTEEFRQSLMLTIAEVADNCPEETEEKHICTDPTCETCEVIRSLMEAESFEATIMPQAEQSTMENPMENTILCVEGNQGTITILENVENIVDLNFQQEQYKMISNITENVQYVEEISNEFHVKELTEHSPNSMDTKSRLDENSEVLFNQPKINANKCETEFDSKNWYEKDLQNKETSYITQQPIIELTSTSREDCCPNWNEKLKTEDELENSMKQDDFNDLNQKLASDSEDVFQIKLSEKETLNTNKNVETFESSKVLQQVSPPSPKLSYISSKSPTNATEKSSTTKNEESESEDSDSNESDSDSSSSSSSSDDESCDDSRDSVKKSTKSDNCSDTDTESELENDGKGDNSDTNKLYHSENSNLEQNMKTKEMLKPTSNESKINNCKRKSKKFLPNKMELDVNTDNDSEYENIPKSPQRIVIRLKKSLQFSPSQNYSKERASDESDNYTGSDSENDKFSEKHFEVISTTLKVKSKETFLRKNSDFKEAKVSDNQTESESEADSISDKKSEIISRALSPRKERSVEDHKLENSLESQTESESENDEILEKKSEINSISLKLSPSQKVCTKYHMLEKSLEPFTENKVHSEDILEKNSEKAFQKSPEPRAESKFQDKNSTHLNISLTLKDVPEGNLSKKSIESDDESVTDDKDIVESTFLKLKSPQTETFEKSPQPSTEFDHQSESESEDDGTSEKKSNLISIPLQLSPRSESFIENHKSEPIIESDTASESEDDEKIEKSESEDDEKIEKTSEMDTTSYKFNPIQKLQDLALEKSPEPMAESKNLKENNFKDLKRSSEMISFPSKLTPIQEDSKGDYSTEKSCQTSTEVENHTNTESKGYTLSLTLGKGLDVVENTPISESITEEGLTVNYTVEKSEDDSEDEEIRKENIKICQKRDVVEKEAKETIEIYNLTESETEDDEENEEELSAKVVPLKEDDNESLLLDSTSSCSDSEYETDDEDETIKTIKKPDDSKPIEISDDESTDNSAINEEIQKPEKSEDHILKFKSKTDIFDSNDTNKSETEKTDDVTFKKFQEEILILKNTVQLELTDQQKLTEQADRDEEASVIMLHNRNENFSLDPESLKETKTDKQLSMNTNSVEIKDTPVANIDKNCEKYISDLPSSSEESDEEMDDKLTTDHENQTEGKLAMLSEFLLQNSTEQGLTNSEENEEHPHDIDDTENSEVLECESKTDKPKSSVNHSQKLENLIENLNTFEENNATSNILLGKTERTEVETKISETISKGILYNLDVDESNSNNEPVNNSTGLENQGENRIIAESNAEVSNVIKHIENIKHIETIENTPKEVESQADNIKHIEIIPCTPEVKESSISEDSNNSILEICKEISDKEPIFTEPITEESVNNSEAIIKEPDVLNETKEYMSEDSSESITEESRILEKSHGETLKSEEMYGENRSVDKSITENCKHVTELKIHESETVVDIKDDDETIAESFHEKSVVENSDVVVNIKNKTSEASEENFDQHQINSENANERQDIEPEDPEDFEKVNSQEMFQLPLNAMETYDRNIIEEYENVAKVGIEEITKKSENIDDYDSNMDNTKKQNQENSKDPTEKTNESESKSNVNADEYIKETKSKDLISFEELFSENDSELSIPIADKIAETSEVLGGRDIQTSSLLKDNLNQTVEETESLALISEAITKTSELVQEGDNQTSFILEDDLDQTEENELFTSISETITETSKPVEERDTLISSILEDNLNKTEEEHELPASISEAITETPELVEEETQISSILEHNLNKTEEENEFPLSISNELTKKFEPEEEAGIKTSVVMVEDSDILKEFEKEDSKNNKEIFVKEDAPKSSKVLESSTSEPITFETLEESLSQNAGNIERSPERIESFEKCATENLETCSKAEKTPKLKEDKTETSESCEEKSDFMHSHRSKLEKVIEEPNSLIEERIEVFEYNEEENGSSQQTLLESEKAISFIEYHNETSPCYEENSNHDHQSLSKPEAASEKSSTLEENKIDAAESYQKDSNADQPTSSKCDELVTAQSPSNEQSPVEIQTEISQLSVNESSIHNILDKDSVSQEDLSGDFLGFKNQSSFEDESGDFHGFEDLEEVTRIRQEIENLNEDSAANDGFLDYSSLNRDPHKTSTTSLTCSTSSEINELEALEKELSQHQTEMPVEDDEDIETDKDLLTECNQIVSTNDIEHIKQMLESDEEPQADGQSDNEDRENVEEAEKDEQELKDKFAENSKTNLNDIISSNISIIPKLSDLCRAALNSSFNSNSNLAQQHNTQTSTLIVERELSVEEALAEMYHQAGVLSDPEDCCDTDNIHTTGDSDEAHDVLLFNLEEILNSDNNDVYVLQCDMNEHVLNVMQTNEEDQQQQQERHQQQQDDNVNTTERVNTVQFIGILDTQNLEPQIHIISSDSESEVIILSDDESDFSYRPFITRHERITIPFINDHELNDSDSLSDISTIHHEEIVPDNLNKFLQEEFYKYLHEKYVQRNISKYYHANRVLKKYKKRFIKTKRQ